MSDVAQVGVRGFRQVDEVVWELGADARVDMRVPARVSSRLGTAVTRAAEQRFILTPIREQEPSRSTAAARRAHGSAGA